MTDITKYRNVSLTHDTYKVLIALSKVLLPDAKLSISKTIESLANEKAKKLNGKFKKYRVHKAICDVCNGNGFVKITDREDPSEVNVHQCWECDSEGEFYVYESKVAQHDDVDNNDRNTDKLLH